MLRSKDILSIIKPTLFISWSFIKKIYPVVKKVLDPVDDIVAAVRAGIAGAIVNILIGVVGSVLHAVEFFSAIAALYKQIKKKTFDYLKTPITTLNLVLSGTGIGLGITLLIGAFTNLPIIPLVLELAPNLIPGLMTVILFGKFIKNLLVLKRKEIKKEKFDDSKGVKGKEMTEFEHHIKQTKTAFSALEVIASAIVLAGVVTALPPITFVGVGLGLLIKYIEYKDEKNNHAISRRIRKFFTGKEIKPDNEIESNTAPKMIITQKENNVPITNNLLTYNNTPLSETPPPEPTYNQSPKIIFKGLNIIEPFPVSTIAPSSNTVNTVDTVDPDEHSNSEPLIRECSVAPALLPILEKKEDTQFKFEIKNNKK